MIDEKHPFQPILPMADEENQNQATKRTVCSSRPRTQGRIVELQRQWMDAMAMSFWKLNNRFLAVEYKY